MQTDLFSAGSTDTARSFPPHLDPEKAHRVDCNRETDADFVNEGAEVGSLGTNAEIWLVTIEDINGETLHAQPFQSEQRAAAYRYMDEITRQIDANRQRQLF